MSSHQSSPAGPADSEEVRAEERRRMIVRELVQTERMYVQHLEMLKRYAAALTQSQSLDQATLDLLFSKVPMLLDFQRKFLVGLEGTAELPTEEQRWERHFVRAEEDFSDVYPRYWANYKQIADISQLLRKHKRRLILFNHLMDFRFELPGLLINPVARLSRYRLLLECLLDASSPASDEHYDELASGLAACERVIGKVREC